MISKNKIQAFEEFSKHHVIEWKMKIGVYGNQTHEYCAAVRCDDCIYNDNSNCAITAINEDEYEYMKSLFPEYFI